MDLDALLAKAKLALSKGVRPESVDAWVARETKGQHASLDALSKEAGGVTLKNLGRSAVMGASFGWAPKALDTLGFKDDAAEMKDRDANFREQSPIASTLAELAGGLAVPGLGAEAAAMKLGKAGLTAGRAAMAAGALTGAGASALSAAGHAEDGNRLAAATNPLTLGAGALIGAAVPKLADVIGEKLNPASAALSRLRDAVERSGGAPAVRKILDEYKRAGVGDEVMLADLSKRLGLAGDFAAHNNPEVLAGAFDKFAARKLNEPDKLSEGFSKLIDGGAPHVSERLAQLEQGQSDWARSAYGDLRTKYASTERTGVKIPKDQLEYVRDAFRAAKRDGSGLEVPELANPDFSDLHETLQRMRAQQDVAFRNGNGHVGATMRSGADRLEQDMSSAYPEFAGVQAQYRAGKEVQRALELGEKRWSSGGFLDVKRDLDALMSSRQAAAKSGDPQLLQLASHAIEQYRYGLASAAYKHLNDMGSGRSAASALMNRSNNVDAKLEAAFGDRAHFEQYVRQIDKQAQMSKLGRIFSSSDTYRRLQDAKVAHPVEQVLDVAGATLGGAGSVASHLASKLRGATVGRLLRDSAGELGPMVFAQGGSAIERVLRKLETNPARQLPTGAGLIPAAAGGLLGR